MTVAISPASPSRSFGKYRVLAKLGEGGMADVYLGLSSGIGGFNKLLVIKRLREGQFDSDEGIRMFVDEARLSALLNHPNVVQTYEVYQEGATYFTVMEYLEGQSLHTVLNHVHKQRGELSTAMIVRIACEVLSGLHHAHELRHPDGRVLGVVHRDVTPHNIFVTYDGVIKLVDFGVAKAATASSATQAGAVKGKTAYLAPEQVKSPDRVDRRADIFQLGIVLFEGLTGRRYWAGEKQYDIFKRLFLNELPSFPADTTLPPALVAICSKALAGSPEDRYATAEDFRRALEDYLEAARCNVTPRRVGEHIASMFAQRRADTRALIEAAIHDLEQANEEGHVSQDLMRLSIPMLQPLSGGESSFGSGSGLTPGSGSRTPSSSGLVAAPYGYQAGMVVAPAPASKTSRALTLGVAGAAAAAILIIVSLLWNSRSTASAGSAENAALPPAAETAAPPKAPVQEPQVAELVAAQAEPTASAAPVAPLTPADGRPPAGGTRGKVRAAPKAETPVAATPATATQAAPPVPTKRERDIE